MLQVWQMIFSQILPLRANNYQAMYSAKQSNWWRIIILHYWHLDSSWLGEKGSMQ